MKQRPLDLAYDLEKGNQAIAPPEIGILAKKEDVGPVCADSTSEWPVPAPSESSIPSLWRLLHSVRAG